MDNEMKKTAPRRKSRDETRRDVMAILLGEEQEPGAADAAPLSLHIDDLVPFASHPFKLYEGGRLDDMVRSVRELGVIVPVIVRPIGGDGGTYEILSGHNRVNAARLAGLEKVPVHVKKGLADDEAALIVTETNLVQRSFTDLSHSERAIALKKHMDALKNGSGGQGKRTDLLDEIKRLSAPGETKGNLTSDPLGQKLTSREQTGQSYELSPTNVARYLRLAELASPLADRVDTGEIAIRSAVSLSYLPPDEQAMLDRLLNEAAYKVDMKKAESLRGLSEGRKLTAEKMGQVLSGELNKKPKPKTPPPFRLKAKIYQKYFDGGTPQSEIEATIEQALAEYFGNHKKEEIA